MEMTFPRVLAIDPERMVAGQIHVFLARNRRAKRYILRVLDEQTARVTVPRGGSRREAVAFLERNRLWLEERMEVMRAGWRVGSEVWYSGRKERIVPKAGGGKAAVGIGGLSVAVRLVSQDLRPEIEAGMRAVAQRELPVLAGRLAAAMATVPRRITVRNQRTRWGSCSCRGVISLNWRLIQTPVAVCEYVIVHELCHLRHMNHSRRFWAAVGEYCPDYRKQEAWLKAHGRLMEGDQS